MSFPENPSDMTSDWAKDFLRDYDGEYDTLDAQGQFNPAQIHAMLAKKFFKNSTYDLDDIRNLIQAEKPTESSTVAEKVADAAAKIVEPRQGTLFETMPSEATEVLRPKNETQTNYEDFEAAWAMQTAGGAKPNDIVFKTVIRWIERQFAMPYAVAKSVMLPPKKGVRVTILQERIWPNEYFE